MFLVLFMAAVMAAIFYRMATPEQRSEADEKMKPIGRRVAACGAVIWIVLIAATYAR